MRPEEAKSLTLHTRFSDKIYRLMELECERLGMKMAEFVRYAVVTYFSSPPVTMNSTPVTKEEESV